MLFVFSQYQIPHLLYFCNTRACGYAIYFYALLSYLMEVISVQVFQQHFQTFKLEICFCE